MATGPTSLPSPFETLQDYLEAVRSMYDACISHVEHDYEIEGVGTTLRLHYVRFDEVGSPKIRALAQALVDHVIYFCIAACHRREPLSTHDSTRLFRKARDLFRKLDRAGEPGELLLYFLLETVLQAPQVVCKMSLKTNPHDEVKGSDGIHVKWDASADCLNVYLGEAKLYQDYGTALKRAFEGIEALHTSGQDEHELNLVTSHFKFLDSELQRVVSEYIDSTNPVGRSKVVHACLIGFDWNSYSQLDGDHRQTFVDSFESHYIEHGRRLAEKTSKLFEGYSQRHLSFEFFFLPFKSVQDFRDEFNRALTGIDG